MKHIDRAQSAGTDPHRIIADLGPVDDLAADDTQPPSRPRSCYHDLSACSLGAAAQYVTLPSLTTACTLAALSTGTLALRRMAPGSGTAGWVPSRARTTRRPREVRFLRDGADVTVC